MISQGEYYEQFKHLLPTPASVFHQRSLPVLSRNVKYKSFGSLRSGEFPQISSLSLVSLAAGERAAWATKCVSPPGWVLPWMNCVVLMWSGINSYYLVCPFVWWSEDIAAPVFRGGLGAGTLIFRAFLRRRGVNYWWLPLDMAISYVHSRPLKWSAAGKITWCHLYGGSCYRKGFCSKCHQSMT